ncbi:xylose isomerase domain-containing protein TIM barrel [Lactobacillus crispatus]|uniref:sugar phosphate isomerase/epimerase family protein n=1 Tax=Lactobacillus crispatus TaxID=47770 RepID=UPI0018E3DA5B|nr:sugar phosphate isomerase/epimerase family protein [Lactobacillus crispatus]MBI1698631.1 xylose isomerase domain-containing protein TIM barrel [Lactobacillus crispatus]
MKCEIGIRAHDLPIYDDLDKLANQLWNYRFYNVQFSPKFSLKDETNNGENMSFGLAHHSKEILDQKQINIAILGCYVNIIHPDLNEKNKAIDLFKHYLAYAKAMDCPIVATETGSITNVYKPQKENWTKKVFDLTVSQIKQLTDEAEKLGVLVGIEPGINHPIYNVETTKKLIDEVKSPNLKIIFDPMNMIYQPEDDEEQIVKDGIKAFGNEIYAFHIKDYKFIDGQKIVAPFGEGLAPMTDIAKIIKNFKARPYVFMEETPKDNFDISVERFENMFH